MNIIRVILTKNILIAVLFLVGTLGAMRYALSPTHYRVFCDQRLAPHVQAGIKKSIHYAPVHLVSSQVLLEELQRMYPAIQHVSISYKSSQQAHVSIEAAVPHFCICSSVPGQKEYILCKKIRSTEALIVEKNLFNESISSTLPTLIIEGEGFEEKRLHAEFVECVRDFKRELLDEFTITWRAKSELVLLSRDLPVTIIADHVTVHEIERCAAVKRIFADDAERYKDGMRADIRLRDTIICAPFKGMYEKSVDV